LEFNVPFQHKHGYIRDEYTSGYAECQVLMEYCRGCFCESVIGRGGI